jgi:hypothetical protein
VLVLLAVRAGAADSSTLLKSLPQRYVSAKWSKFVEERKSDMEELLAFTKGPKKEKKDDKGGPAVVKVLARCRLPVRALLDTFQSKDEEVLAEWNQFAGDVQHIDKGIQLQTYALPWPFMPRDYLVRCSDRTDKHGHTAYCASLEDHKRAPERKEYVRGHSETIWRFSEDPDGGTSIHLETLVDPRGRLPAWVIDKASKLASVSVVRALVKATSSRVQKLQQTAADDGGLWASMTGFVQRLVYS